MKNYRILQIHNFYQIPGGEDVVVRNEKRLLEEHGHKVYTYYRSNSELAKKGIVGKLFLPFTAVFSLKTYREVKKLIRENQIDIVHVHNTLTMVSPSVFYAAFRCKVPVVQTLHNFRMLCPAGSFFRDNVICEECVRTEWLRHPAQVLPEQQAAVFCQRRHPADSQVCGDIPQGEFYLSDRVQPEEAAGIAGYKERDRESGTGLHQAEFYLRGGDRAERGALGRRIFPVCRACGSLKGIDIAVRAFEKLPDKKLYVAGNGPMMEEMQRYVREHHMENVKFLGYLQKDEMSEKFYQAKAVIMTSQCYEAFAMTIAEAYSYGVPVIAGRVGNMDGMVQDGITGVKFTYNSAEDLADKISAFDAMDLSVLKKNARAFYAERLRPEDNYQKLIRIYEDISK